MKTAIAEITLAISIAIFSAAVIAAEPEPAEPERNRPPSAEFASVAAGPIEDRNDEDVTRPHHGPWPYDDPAATKQRLRARVGYAIGH